MVVYNIVEQANKGNDEVYTQLTLLPVQEVFFEIVNACFSHPAILNSCSWSSCVVVEDISCYVC